VRSLHNEAPRLVELQVQDNAVRTLGQVLEDLKGNGVLETLNLQGNQVTDGLYLEPIEAEMDLKAYTDLCGREETELIKYRAALICHIGPCLRHLDGLLVSERELETALDLEHRGELISFPSAMSSIELVPPSQDTSAEFLLRSSPVKGRHVPTNSAASDVSEAFSLVQVREGKRERKHCNSIASSEAAAKPAASARTGEMKAERGEKLQVKVTSVDFPTEKPTSTGEFEDKIHPNPQNRQKDQEKSHIAQKTRYKESRTGKDSDYYHHYSTFAHSLTPPPDPVPTGRKHHCHCSKHHHKTHRLPSGKENLPQPVKVLREVATSTRQSVDMCPEYPVSEEAVENRLNQKTKNRRKGWKLSMETDVSSHRTASYGEEVETPAISTRNRTTTQASRSKSIEAMGRNPCRTPESVYSSPNTDIQTQLVLYACTPSRPVLTSEASAPLHCVLSPKGSEFALIVQLLRPYRVHRVLKTYTYSQQRAVLGLDRPDSTFLARHAALDRLTLLFYGGEEAELGALCSSALGFQSSAQPVHFSTHVEVGSQLSLLCLVDLGRVYEDCTQETEVLRGYQSVRLAEDRYLLLAAHCAVPVYLIAFASD